MGSQMSYTLKTYLKTLPPTSCVNLAETWDISKSYSLFYKKGDYATYLKRITETLNCLMSKGFINSKKNYTNIQYYYKALIIYNKNT